MITFEIENIINKHSEMYKIRFYGKNFLDKKYYKQAHSKYDKKKQFYYLIKMFKILNIVNKHIQRFLKYDLTNC